MIQKIGRNDPCSCGSGKKFKQCCMNKVTQPGGLRKFKAKVISAKPSPAVEQSQPAAETPDLIQRTFSPLLEKQEDSPES